MQTLHTSASCPVFQLGPLRYKTMDRTVSLQKRRYLLQEYIPRAQQNGGKGTQSAPAGDSATLGFHRHFAASPLLHNMVVRQLVTV
jgi:hypothetical protein